MTARRLWPVARRCFPATRSITAYERTAFGELTGGFWIPLLLLFALRDGNSSGSMGQARTRMAPHGPCRWSSPEHGSPTRHWGSWPAICWLPLPLVAALLARSWAPVLRAAVAAVLGLGLAAIYLLPAAWEQRWVDIRQATDDPGLLIENSWLFARHANPALALHDVELHKVSIIAVAMIVLALGGLLVCWWRGGRDPENRFRPRRWWIPLALIPVAVLFLQFPVSLPIWNLLPKLRFLQFPWRWLVTLEAPMAIFFAAAVWPRRHGCRVAVAVVCATIFLGATIFTARHFFQPCDDEDAVSSMVSAYRNGAGFEGVDEYAPNGADSTLIPTGLPDACLVVDPATVLGVPSDDEDADESRPAWNAGQGGCETTLHWQSGEPEQKTLRAVLPHAGYMILRLRSYPAWQIAVNGRSLDSLPRRDDGLIAVPVPQGPVDLTVDWTTTPDVIAGRWLSSLPCCCSQDFGFWKRKLRRSRLS